MPIVWNGYERYQGLQSGIKEGSIVGRLPFDNGGASAFMYYKDISMFIPAAASSGDSLSKKLKGLWRFRIRENAAKVGTEYTGRILFEQTVSFTPQVVAGNFGLDFVSFTDAIVKPQTSIVDGQACAVIEDINTATDAQKAAYVETGAWRFFEMYKYTGKTAEDKLRLEGGILDKDQPDYGLGIGGFYLFGRWISSAYKCQIPEGAVVEVDVDQWQIGRLSREATYQFSWKKGVGKSPYFVHPAGYLNSAIPSDGNMLVEAYTGAVTDKELLSTIKAVAPISLDQHYATGVIYAGVKTANGTQLITSKTDGASFSMKVSNGAELVDMAQAFDSSYSTHDFELLFGATAGAVATKDGKIYFKISYDGGISWQTEVLVGNVTTGMKSLVLRQHHVNSKALLTITDSASCRYDSVSDGAKWSAIT